MRRAIRFGRADFGRFGNIINGDIVGYPSTLPWATALSDPHSFVGLAQSRTCRNRTRCSQPPLTKFCAILSCWPSCLSGSRLRRPGILALVYLFGYVITQFLVFFARANDIVSFLGLNWGLKQAQWTSVVVFIVMIPIAFLVLRFSRPVPVGEVAATYGIPQKVEAEPDVEARRGGATS